MQGEDKNNNAGDKNKPTFSKHGVSEHPMRRLDSFATKFQIFGSGILGGSINQHKDIPIIPDQQILVPKEQTHGNVFKGFRREQVQKVPEPKLIPSNNYEIQCLEYEKYLFDDRIKHIIKRMAIKAYNLFKNQKQSHFFIFPIQKLLVTIAKKLLLNRFQLFFLQYTFEMTKWNYNLELIKRHSGSFQSYIMIPDSQSGNSDIKLMEIYILYCAYFAKKSLNELSVDNMFNTFCQKLCPKFKDYFPQWTQNSGMAAKINPKQLNSIFKKLTYNFQKEHEDFQNYCLVVEQIIDISPAYNADKSGKPKKVRKSKKELKSKQQQIVNQDQREQSNYNKPLDIVQHDQSLDIEPPIFRQKKSSVLSVDLLEANHYITRSVSQNERR